MKIIFFSDKKKNQLKICKMCGILEEDKFFREKGSREEHEELCFDSGLVMRW